MFISFWKGVAWNYHRTSIPSSTMFIHFWKVYQKNTAIIRDTHQINWNCFFLHLNCQLRWKDIICYIFPARLCKRLDDAPENHWSQRQVMHVMQHSCGYELTTCTRECHLQLRISGTTTGWKDELGVWCWCWTHWCRCSFWCCWFWHFRPKWRYTSN